MWEKFKKRDDDVPVTQRLAPHGVYIDMIPSPKPEIFGSEHGMPGPNYKGFKHREEILPKGYRQNPDSMPLKENLLCEYDLPVKLRDGITIFCDVRRPDPRDSAERVPAIFAWSPYGKAYRGFHHFFPLRMGIAPDQTSSLEHAEAPDPAYFCPRGYAMPWPARSLILGNKHQALTNVPGGGTSSKDCPEISLLREFLLMSLYVSMDDVQLFAGRHGEKEARRAYMALQTWLQDNKSGRAAWHAGQVLRAGRGVPPFQLRGYETLALYQATLMLWCYGILRCVTARHSSTPETLTSYATSPDLSMRDGRGPRVCLNGPPSEFTALFYEHGNGCPGLHDQRLEYSENNQPYCDLRKSQSVMAVGVDILERNYPGYPTNISLPPFVERI